MRSAGRSTAVGGGGPRARGGGRGGTMDIQCNTPRPAMTTAFLLGRSIEPHHTYKFGLKRVCEPVGPEELEALITLFLP